LFKLGLTLPILIFLVWKIGPMIPNGGADTIFGLLTATVCLKVLAMIWQGTITDIVAKPFTSLYDGGNEEIEAKPYYSIAMGMKKKGRTHDAIMEIRKQLDKFPNDFQGVTLLANVHAEDMKDLQGAENIFNHFCERPEAPPKQVAAALTQLADWHLKIGVDVDSARAVLQRLIERYPGTEIALAAEQRISHLGGAEKILLEHHDRQNIAVPAGVNNIGLLDSSAFLQPPEIEPGKLAAAHVQHLAEHPHDSEMREKLAMIYARDFKRLDLATLELAQLINEPRHSPKQVAKWLNLLANFQVDLGADVDTVRATLEKIVELFPDLPVAEVAQRRLALLNLEFKGKEKTPDVKLGVYEQNIGLKYGSPRRGG
jgi:tetratricopeptide (TPR) repeat protein